MKLVRTFLATAIAAFAFNAQAVAINTDGTWNEFDFDAPGSALYDLNTLETSFTFTLTQSSLLSVIDAGFSGDRFEIHANGSLLGLTSAPITQGASEEPIFDIATLLGDNRFSKGSWNLAAGSYTITGLAAESVGGGLGYMSITAVPEPKSYAMLLAGLGLMGTIARRRNRNA